MDLLGVCIGSKTDVSSGVSPLFIDQPEYFGMPFVAIPTPTTSMTATAMTVTTGTVYEDEAASHSVVETDQSSVASPTSLFSHTNSLPLPIVQSAINTISIDLCRLSLLLPSHSHPDLTLTSITSPQPLPALFLSPPITTNEGAVAATISTNSPLTGTSRSRKTARNPNSYNHPSVHFRTKSNACSFDKQSNAFEVNTDMRSWFASSSHIPTFEGTNTDAIITTTTTATAPHAPPTVPSTAPSQYPTTTRSTKVIPSRQALTQPTPLSQLQQQLPTYPSHILHVGMTNIDSLTKARIIRTDKNGAEGLKFDPAVIKLLSDVYIHGGTGYNMTPIQCCLYNLDVARRAGFTCRAAVFETILTLLPDRSSTSGGTGSGLSYASTANPTTTVPMVKSDSDMMLSECVSLSFTTTLIGETLVSA